MGINRISTFLHALASSSGVSVGGVGRRPTYVVDDLSSFAAIVKVGVNEERREEKEGESLANLSENAPSNRSVFSVPTFFRSRIKIRT